MVESRAHRGRSAAFVHHHFLNVAWISRLWDQDHSIRSDQPALICGTGWVRFIYRSKRFLLRTNVWGERYKIVPQSAWTGRQVFLRELGVLPFVNAHHWDKLLGDLFIHSAWNNCIISATTKRHKGAMKIPSDVYESLKSPITFPFIFKHPRRIACWGGLQGEGSQEGDPGPGRDVDYGEDKRSESPLLWSWMGLGQQAVPYTGLLHAARTS